MSEKITPRDYWDQAKVIAAQIMAMPEAQKDSALVKFKQADPTLHACVKNHLEEMRREARGDKPADPA